jgi:hypothetical protein
MQGSPRAQALLAQRCEQRRSVAGRVKGGVAEARNHLPRAQTRLLLSPADSYVAVTWQLHGSVMRVKVAIDKLN